jgi:Helicase HerA, central domain
MGEQMNKNNPQISYGLWACNYISALAHQTGMKNDPRVIHALRMITYKSKDQPAVKKIVTRMHNLITKSPAYIALTQSKNPFMPYPSPGAINGEIKIGYVYDEIRKISYPFGISRNQLMQHMLESGRSGAGKTTLLIILLTNLMKLGVPFWIFDFKRDYRCLLRGNDNLNVFNWKNFQFNPLKPPQGTQPIQWASIFTEIFFGNFYSSAASSAKSLFLQTLITLYEQPGIPSMTKFSEALENKLHDGSCPSSTKDSIRTIQLRLKPFISILGDSVQGDGYAIDELLKRQVVLELDGLTIEYQTFIATMIFHWIFTYRLNLAERGELKHVLLFDEAKRLFSLGIPLVGQLVSLAREFGQGLIMADQMPSALDHAVHANIFTTITLNLAATRDINAMAYAMALNAEQRTCLNSLPMKTAIIKLAGGYTKPFMIHIPELQVDKNISNDEVEKHMQPILTELEPESPEVNVEQTPGSQSKPTSQNQEQPSTLSDNETALLWDIKNRPYIPATERQRSLNFTTYMAGKLYSELIEKGYLIEYEIKVNLRGRPQKFYELTKQGINLIGKQNLGAGKGGFLHRFHQHRLKDVFERQGYKAVIEECKKGKCADLGLTDKSGKAIAVEIAMSVQGEISNIEKDLAACWKEVWTLCNSETILNNIKAEWASSRQEHSRSIVEIFSIYENKFY